LVKWFVRKYFKDWDCCVVAESTIMHPWPVCVNDTYWIGIGTIYEAVKNNIPRKKLLDWLEYDYNSAIDCKKNEVNFCRPWLLKYIKAQKKDKAEIQRLRKELENSLPPLAK